MKNVQELNFCPKNDQIMGMSNEPKLKKHLKLHKSFFKISANLNHADKKVFFRINYLLAEDRDFQFSL